MDTINRIVRAIVSPVLRLVRPALVALAIGGSLLAQLPNLIPETPKQEQLQDPFHRETPRSSFLAFVNAVQADNNAVNAAQYLELPDRISAQDRDAILRKFRMVLDRRFFSAISSISNQPTGTLQDGLDPNSEIAGVISSDRGPIDVVLRRVRDGNNGLIWLVSKETVAEIPKIHDEIAPLDLDTYLPEALAGKRLFSIPAGVLLTAILLLPIAYALAWLLLAIPRTLLRLIGKGDLISRWRWPNSLWLLFSIAVAIHAGAIYYLGVPLLFRYYYGRLVAVLLLFALCLFLFGAMDNIGGRILRLLRARGKVTAVSFVALGQRVVKALIALGSILIGLTVFGFDLSTALAAIGIGGLALALAAQKTLENLFGGASIIADEAIQVGEFCKIGEIKGFVEDIGLRSTRIRTLDRTTVTAPNALVASVNVENFSRRDKFWFHPTLGLRYETSAEQIREVLSRIRTLLREHPQVENESGRVRFLQLASYSLDIEVFAYVFAADFAAFLEIQEGLLLSIMEIVETAGAAFAFPSQTMYLARDK